jgi:hypothetical protein
VREELTVDIKQQIEAANQEALNRLTDAVPVLVDIAPAGEVMPGMRDRLITHAGPPITWERMSGAQRGAVIGQVLYEEWAKTPEEAEALLRAGEIALEPNHHHDAVGPMAGTISPSSWVYVVENRAHGNRAFCRQVEGMQQFGDYSDKALQGLRDWRDTYAPALRAALKCEGELPLLPILVQALQMGDELHNRHSGASALFGNAMAVGLAKADLPRRQQIATLYLLKNHNLIFLGIAMAAGKAIADPARNVAYSTLVTAMCRNGTEFGIRVSGLDDAWFTAPAPVVEGLYVPGFSAQDAGRDMGDSAITETVGWGGFVLAGATGILPLVGGTPEEAFDYTREMRTITAGAHPLYKLPVLGFEGAPIGIDIRKVVQTNNTPIIDTAIAHKLPGYPKIGGGLVRAPFECFKKALVAFGQRYSGK